MRRKTLKRMFYMIIAGVILYVAGVFFFSRSMSVMDTKEIDLYYDLLTKHERTSGKLIYDLGISEGSSLEDAFKKLSAIFGFEGSPMMLTRTNQERPPAKIIDHGYGAIEIQLSKSIADRREQINVLVHELCHIYVWHLDQSVFAKCDQEKLTDCMGVHLGLGVLILNGLTDDVFFLPGGEYESRSKFFGYLKPEEFGYIVARFTTENNIRENDVMNHLSPTGKKYFRIGLENIKNKSEAARASHLPK